MERIIFGQVMVKEMGKVVVIYKAIFFITIAVKTEYGKAIITQKSLFWKKTFIVSESQSVIIKKYL